MSRLSDPTRVGVRGPQSVAPEVLQDNLLDNLPTTALAKASLAPGRDAATEQAALTPGSKVGRYLIVEHVGTGGLGYVYKAYDPELDRRVAIKILRSEVVDANRRLGDPTDRLRREAQALAKLRHPNVVAVHDVGTVGGEVFIAMAFAEGLTLLPWAAERQHRWQAVREVMVRAGEGLAAAHDAGLVHRDFKPANVVVGDDGHVTVLDFGLARAVHQPADAHAPDPAVAEPTVAAPRPDPDSLPSTSLLSREVTGASLLLGTPPYMAPELFASSAATGASDQFAYCVTLFRLLLDRLPFIAPNPTEFCHAVSAGRLDWSGSKVPAWLMRVVARGLRADPSERFPNMRALLDALRTDRRRRRNRWIALSIVVPLAGVATAVGTWALRPPPTAAERAVTDELASDARTAAARGYYVHPGTEDPSMPTAYGKVLELEALQGAVEAEADERAAELRQEFAAALIRFGDRYYARDGGVPFAADFYAAALVFVPDNAHAAGRVALSPPQLAALAQQAQAQSFSPRELAAAQPLAILADTQASTRSARLRRFLARDDQTPARTRTVLEGLVQADPDAARVAQATPSLAAVQPSAATGNHPTGDDATLPGGESSGRAEGSAPGEPGRAGNDPTWTDPTPAKGRAGQRRAATEAAAGMRALKQGDLARAAPYFHRALEANRKNLAALRGLARVHYERGEYANALGFAKRGRAVAPRSKQIALLMGDAYVKTLDYAAARRAYERAQSLGSAAADDRLARLSARLGQ